MIKTMIITFQILTKGMADAFGFIRKVSLEKVIQPEHQNKVVVICEYNNLLLLMEIPSFGDKVGWIIGVNYLYLNKSMLIWKNWDFQTV